MPVSLTGVKSVTGGENSTHQVIFGERPKLLKIFYLAVTRYQVIGNQVAIGLLKGGAENDEHFILHRERD